MQTKTPLRQASRTKSASPAAPTQTQTHKRDQTRFDIGVRAVAILVTLAFAAPAAAQVALPFTASPTINVLNLQRTYTIDLGTLPTRPILYVEAAGTSYPETAVLELTLDNFQGDFTGPGACPYSETTILSEPGLGPKELTWSGIACDPRPGAFVGHTVDATIRVISFGGPGAILGDPIDITIRAETRPPFGTLTIPYSPSFAQESVTIIASKDTTIYEGSETSDGAGDFLWVGTDVTFSGPFITDRERRALLAFDLTGKVPATANIDQVDIQLRAQGFRGSNRTVSIRRVASSPAGTWLEGDAIGPGDEFSGAVPSGASATYGFRKIESIPWTVTGGDPIGSFLDSKNFSVLGDLAFSSIALDNAVQDMVATGEDQDGFVLSMFNLFPSTDQGVQFDSSDHFGSGTSRPRMMVIFTPTEPYQDGLGASGAVSFINEGENLRWIYDLDNDDILHTDVGGICSINEDFSGNVVPYSYQFTGTPFTGHDCCTWHLDSPQTGTLGTGQAIFFHNLDPANPANLPPDTDGDGIRDNCDNCVLVANGPLLGTCLGGTNDGNLCNNDAECSLGGNCSLSQEDSDDDFVGDACVPEPGFAALLFVGMFGLTTAAKRRPHHAR